MMAVLEHDTKSRVAAAILVVDDEPDLLDVVVMMLEVEGYRTRTARDGMEALEIIERERPALVLLDMRMPRMNGWELAKALTERGIDVPTAAHDARRWAEEVDADAFLGKPFQLQALLDTVDRVLSKDA